MRRPAEAVGQPTATAVLVHPDDNVVTLPDGGDAGVLICAPGVPTAVHTVCTVPPGHKVAIRHVAAGDYVLKYGQPIGRATQTIEVGDHVHTHNLASARAGGPGHTNAKDGGE
jgi:altronate hydrolase